MPFIKRNIAKDFSKMKKIINDLSPKNKVHIIKVYYNKYSNKEYIYENLYIYYILNKNKKFKS